jgi:hypothetical protein
LFGYIVGGAVKNLGVEDINIRGRIYIGGIAGMIYGSTISNCYTSGTITGNDGFAGGIVDRVADNSVIENCYSTAAISGANYIGGIAGSINGNRNMVRNSAALNPGIICAGSSVGRVSRNGNANTSSNNIAFAGMTVNGDLISNGTAANENGQNITAAQIRADGTLGGRFTAANGWITQNGKLPGFGQARDMPEHLK